ncbi:hypothetical protein Rxycam_02024 [Rubrobacter xylanophilus DSM 9941]|nr:hypothetical protein Rxycam_02024 [Rubrobacter xylanophilus DSM 9941]
MSGPGGFLRDTRQQLSRERRECRVLLKGQERGM